MTSSRNQHVSSSNEGGMETTRLLMKIAGTMPSTMKKEKREAEQLCSPSITSSISLTLVLLRQPFAAVSHDCTDRLATSCTYGACWEFDCLWYE